MRKGITPIIAIIVLLLITVALAGAAWSYLSTYMTGLTGQSIEVRDYFCVGSNTGTVIIANTGTLDIKLSEISIIDMNTGNGIDGNWSYVNGTDIVAENSYEVPSNGMVKWDDEGVCTTGGCSYRIVGGTARAQIARIFC